MLPDDFLEKYEAELGFIVLQNPDYDMTITGAGYLAETIRNKLETAKARIAASTDKTDKALTKLHGAADQADQIAVTIENEANDLTAFVGQFSNSIGATDGNAK